MERLRQFQSVAGIGVTLLSLVYALWFAWFLLRTITGHIHPPVGDLIGATAAMFMLTMAASTLTRR